MSGKDKSEGWRITWAILSATTTLRSYMVAHLEALESCRQVPKQSRADFRALIAAGRSTRRIKNPEAAIEWLTKYLPTLVEILRQSRDWPALEGSDATFKHGAFDVINQASQDPEVLKKTLTLTERTIRGSGVPGLQKVLYGTVFLVQKIKGNITAHYRLREDDIQVSAQKRFTTHQEHTLLHELGHRYWSKFADTDRKRLWATHHMRMGYAATPKPEVGDIIADRYVYLGEERLPNGRLGIRVRDQKKGEEFVAAYSAVAPLLEKTKYPTLYAAKDREEHFCEALALYLLDNLKSPHKEAFEAIWIRREDPSKIKVAAAAGVIDTRLWEQVEELARGQREFIRAHGKTVTAPNHGTGFTRFPTQQSLDWAVQAYTQLGGKWSPKPN